MSEVVNSNKLNLEDYGISELLNKDAMYVSWLEVEKAIAKAQGELNIIPNDVAKAIEKKAQYQNINWEKINALFLQQGYDFYPFVEELILACGEAGKYVHFGVTTQNVRQTGELLIAKEINRRFLIIISNILENLAMLAEKYSETVMPGRTYDRHAVPITFGFKVATWISDILGATQRLKNFHNNGFTSMCGGTVGAYNALGEKGPELNNRVGSILGLTPMDVPARNIHANILEYINEVAMLVNPLNRIAEEVYLTSIEEFDELSELGMCQQIGNKMVENVKSPKFSRNIIANSEKLYAIVGPLYYASAKPFEADSSTNMFLDGQLHEALSLVSKILSQAEELTRTLQINVDQMWKNANKTHGLDNIENVMINLTRVAGRSKAHKIVCELVKSAKEKNLKFQDLALSDLELLKYFSDEEIRNMLDPQNYIGLSAEIAVGQAKKAREQSFILKQLYLD